MFCYISINMNTIYNDIIIAGSGPTGLMLANQLTRFGIDYIILDQKPGPTDQSRALVVHARSMEIYEQLGLSDQIVADGQKNDGMNFYKEGKMITSVTIVNPDEKASPFPYLMMYEQSKNETLLYNNLLSQHRQVLWNTSISSIEEKEGIYAIKTVQGDQENTYECKYLIACDGSKSMVRDFSNMSFTGGSYLNVFYVADTHVDAGFSSEKLSLFLTNHGVAILFPMKGLHHFRALGILPKEYYHRDDLPFEEILNEAKKEMKMPVTFYDTNWHSTYRLHHKKVTSFNLGNIFFAGDAAHVHSPAGGQGMNTGLQDAYNLAWKLALVKKNQASAALLNTYHEERNPVANELLKTTDRLFSFMSTDGFWFSFFRLYLIPFFVPIITKSRTVRKQLFLLVSQININYFSSSLAKGKAGKIRAGARLPFLTVVQNKISISIYKLIKEKAIHPFTVLSYNIVSDGFEQLDKSLYNIVAVEINDNNNKAFKEAGFPRSFVLVIRPDNYIGYISERTNVEKLNHFMKEAYFLR